MTKTSPRSNDQRATVKNPTSKDYAADRANRIGQGHVNVPPPPPTPAAPTTPKK